MSNERYELSNREGSLNTARLLYVAKSCYDAGWHSTPHSHTHAEVFYCVQGGGYLSAGPDRVELKKDSLVLMNPGVIHTEHSVGGTPLEYIVLGVDNVEFASAENPMMRYSVLNMPDRRRELLFFFDDIRNEMAARQEACEQVCQLLLRALLLKINRFSACDVTMRVRAPVSPECEEVRRYINEHYFEDIDLDALAAHTHINKFYLAHQFQKEQGISPIRFLSERRIREAKYLLENTDHSLAQISEMIGFSSLSYFSQSFRRSVGLSPSDYRTAVCRDPKSNAPSSAR